MTPNEAAAYLHNTLPKRPELLEDDEHTAALLALAPLAGGEPDEPTDEDVERLAVAWFGAHAWDPAPEPVRLHLRNQTRAAIERGVPIPSKPAPEPPKRFITSVRPGVEHNWHDVDEDVEADDVVGPVSPHARFSDRLPDAQQRAEALRDELNGETPTHQHCDGDPIECSVQGMQGEWEEAKHQRDALATDLAVTVERLGDAELGQAAALARAAAAEARVTELEAELARANRKLAEPQNPVVVAVGWQPDAEAAPRKVTAEDMKRAGGIAPTMPGDSYPERQAAAVNAVLASKADA